MPNLDKPEIPNTRHQIPNKSQIPISNKRICGKLFGILNLAIVICLFFGICDLGFTYYPIDWHPEF